MWIYIYNNQNHLIGIVIRKSITNRHYKNVSFKKTHFVYHKLDMLHFIIYYLIDVVHYLQTIQYSTLQVIELICAINYRINTS